MKGNWITDVGLPLLVGVSIVALILATSWTYMRGYTRWAATKWWLASTGGMFRHGPVVTLILVLTVVPVLAFAAWHLLWLILWSIGRVSKLIPPAPPLARLQATPEEPHAIQTTRPAELAVPEAAPTRRQISDIERRMEDKIARMRADLQTNERSKTVNERGRPGAMTMMGSANPFAEYEALALAVFLADLFRREGPFDPNTYRCEVDAVSGLYRIFEANAVVAQYRYSSRDSSMTKVRT